MEVDAIVLIFSLRFLSFIFSSLQVLKFQQILALLAFSGPTNENSTPKGQVLRGLSGLKTTVFFSFLSTSTDTVVFVRCWRLRWVHTSFVALLRLQLGSSSINLKSGPLQMARNSALVLLSLRLRHFFCKETGSSENTLINPVSRCVDWSLDQARSSQDRRRRKRNILMCSVRFLGKSRSSTS